MVTSRRNRCFHLLVSLLILNVTSAEGRTASSAAGGHSKVELHNLSLANLTDTYFKSFNSDLALLRISRCKIDHVDVHAFDGLKRLNMLEVSDSPIRGEIHPDTFAGISSLEMLTLRNVGLRRVSLNLTNVQELVLARNEIENLEENSIEGGNVNYLDVSGNKMKRLENSLGSMKKLSMIDISKNQIERIGSRVFENNPNLIRILAAENKISSTDGLKVPKLKTLDLFANRISALGSKSFEKMAFLEELVLAFNTIKVIDDPFRDLIELKFVNLAWNFIEEIRPDLFRNNLYLSHVSLQGNRVKALDKFVSVLEHLTKLDLSHNQLSFIDQDFFQSTPNLNVLNLSFNKLKFLSDALQPLNSLKVLDLAYNQMVLTGYEFNLNPRLSRVNLSSNNLELNLNHFRNNLKLTVLDLSDNLISDFCTGDFDLPELRKLNLRGNHVKGLKCLTGKGFESLCASDVRNNPLSCGKDLDDLVTALAMKKGSPHVVYAGHDLDTPMDQCDILSLNQSFRMWNSVKRELCPNGEIQQQELSESDEDEDDDEDEDEDEDDEDSFEDDSYPESSEEDSTEQAATINDKRLTTRTKDEHFVVIPIGKLTKDMFKGTLKESQSERVSWEQINKNANVADDYEEEEVVKEDEEATTTNRYHYNWYTIVLGLLGIGLSLACLNLLVYLYIRVRIWRRTDESAQKKYTFLKNEVYKNTTEPSSVEKSRDSIWFPNEKTRGYGKINEFFHNFSGSKKEADSDSAKNVLIHSVSNLGDVQNC